MTLDASEQTRKMPAYSKLAQSFGFRFARNATRIFVPNEMADVITHNYRQMRRGCENARLIRPICTSPRLLDKLIWQLLSVETTKRSFHLGIG